MEKSPKANSHTWLGHISYCHLPPLSDPRRWFALCYGSSRPTRANSERNWEGRSLGRIHLILDAGATPPRPRFLLPAIKSQAENECLLPACEGSEARRPQPACWPCSEWCTVPSFLFLSGHPRQATALSGLSLDALHSLTGSAYLPASFP